MINLLHVLSDTNIGGAGIYLYNLTKSLNKEKYKVFVACPRNSQITKMIDSSVTVIETSMKPDKSFDTGCIYELVKIIKQNKISVVHTHASLSGRVAAKIAGAKIIYTRHTPGEVHKHGSLKWKFNKCINIFLSDKVIAVSNYIADQLKEYGLPNDRIVTIHNGINVSEFSQSFNIEESKRTFGLEDEFVLLQIARLEDEKGHKYLFEAISQLDNKYKVKLLVVGTGSKMNELKNLAAKLNIQEKVVFTGFVNDVKQVIPAADVIMLPSLKEALALSLLEGMVMSKPCIASNVGGIPEVVVNGISGILVQPKSNKSIKEAIEKLYNNRELCVKMGQEGKKIVLEKFNLDNMTKQVERVYDSLV